MNNIVFSKLHVCWLIIYYYTYDGLQTYRLRDHSTIWKCCLLKKELHNQARINYFQNYLISAKFATLLSPQLNLIS